MGYTTEFVGSLEITPPLKNKKVKHINEFSDTRHDNHEIGIWCQWVVSDDGTKLMWDGNEKFYNYVEWLGYVIKKFIAPKHMANGIIKFRGEEFNDMGTITVINNKVTVDHF